MNSIQYRPEIDGLRAFAVVPVILFHMGFSWIAGGYIGVDVFFVISGFLITSIVKEELESRSMSFREFWARRIKRILPVMIVVTASSLAVTYLFVFKGDHPAIGQQAMAAMLSLANVYFWHSVGDYWGTSAEQSPFLHTWSLSVEEQFYIVFPIAIWLIYRFRPQWLRSAILSVVMVSLPLFLWGSLYHPNAAFYLLPTRAWELATGCYLAIVLTDKRGDSTLGLAGLCMILASYLFVPTLNGGLAIGVFGTVLVIAFGQSGICYSLLSHRYVVLVGKMSYSLYLWHWPVHVFGEYFGFGSYNLLLLGIVCLLSAASYYLVEKPTRRRRHIIPAIAATYAITLGLSFALSFSSGQYDTSAFERPTWHGLYYDLKPRNQLSENKAFMARSAAITMPEHVAPIDTYKHGGIIVGDGTPRVVLLGDSHGVMWSDTIRKATTNLGLAASFWSINGTSPFMNLPPSENQSVPDLTPEEKYQFDQARLESISKWKPDIVVICARWSMIKESDTIDFLDFLEEHVKHVLFVEQPPELTIGNRNALQHICYQGIMPEVGVKKYLPTGNQSACEKGRQLIRTLSSKYRNCRVVPTFDLYDKNDLALVLDGTSVLYLDDDHLTSDGTQLGIHRIEKTLAELIGSSD